MGKKNMKIKNSGFKKIFTKNKKQISLRKKCVQKYSREGYITDLSFIDKFEDAEKQRITKYEKENQIYILNQRKFELKIYFRPLTNNIEFIGTFESNNYNEKNNSKKKLNNCSYYLIQNNQIIIPVAMRDINNKSKNLTDINNNNNISSDKNNKIETKKNINNKYRIKKKLIKKQKEKEFLYIHISKNNLINLLLINELNLINYILMFLSGTYSGYYQEKNKKNELILKVDSFHLTLAMNKDYYDIDVFGKGKDEYGEYIIKGKMSLINNLQNYLELNNSNIIEISKIINFGNIFFTKNYNII